MTNGSKDNIKLIDTKIKLDFRKLLDRLESINENGSFFNDESVSLDDVIQSDERCNQIISKDIILVEAILKSEDYESICNEITKNFKGCVSVLNFYDVFAIHINSKTKENFLDLVFDKLWILNVKNNDDWHPWRDQFDPQMGGNELFKEGYIKHRIGLDGIIELDATYDWWKPSEFINSLKKFLTNQRYETLIIELFHLIVSTKDYEIVIDINYDYDKKPTGKKLLKLEKLLRNSFKENQNQTIKILAEASGLKLNEFEKINLSMLTDEIIAIYSDIEITENNV